MYNCRTRPYFIRTVKALLTHLPGRYVTGLLHLPTSSSCVRGRSGGQTSANLFRGLLCTSKAFNICIKNVLSQAFLQRHFIILLLMAHSVYDCRYFHKILVRLNECIFSILSSHIEKGFSKLEENSKKLSEERTC